MKVLLLLTDLDAGGAERQVAALARHVASAGHIVLVVSVLPVGVVAAALRDDGIAVASLDVRRPAAGLAAIRRLRRIVAAFAPDVIHAHMYHANILARIACGWRRQSPVVCTIHSIDDGGWWRQRAYRWTDHLHSVTTHVASRGVDRYVGLGLVAAARMRWMPNGIDDVPTSPVDATTTGAAESVPFRWLYVGRLEREKRVDRLLRCFAALVAALPEHSFQLEIVGDGRRRAELEAQAQQLGISQRVTFIGFLADPRPQYGEADAFVSVSDREGLPLTLLEAGAAGLPALVTDVGGVTDVISGPGLGWVVPTDEAAILDAMLDVVRCTAAERVGVGARLQERVRAVFAMPQIAAAWMALYREVAKQ